MSRCISEGRCGRNLVSLLSGLLILGIACPLLWADGASFDLIGPTIDVKVERDGRTLPIAKVPNLRAGDRLWLHPDFPPTQSVHYLMVVVFLRGATNPPPDSWFNRIETWNKPVQDEGVYITVPAEAEEALIFLAPETGGAFPTLRSAVRAKPGAFVRAAQDLDQASLDRQRLEKYLEVVRDLPLNNPAQLKTQTTLLARSLNMRLDQQCFDKPTDLQVPCLTQNGDQLVLDDQHSQTMVAMLTTGPSSDLLAQVSATPSARGGYYSAYVGAVVDVARILGTAHTAQFQYIPALALPREDELHLRLNNPPSFRNPKSVLVVGLPLVRPALNPPLRVLDPAQVFCLDQASLVLPAEGAPLVFATNLAHDFVLHVETKSGLNIDLPAKPDPLLGGFVVDTYHVQPTQGDAELSAILRGQWGFHTFEGPRFELRTSRSGQWVVASKDASALIVGREDTLHLESRDACCVHDVKLKNAQGQLIDTEWKLAKPDQLEVKIPLQNASAGMATLLVTKFGLHAPDEIPLRSYSEAGRLDAFRIHAGDSEGILKGTRLDQVLAVEVNGLRFAPANLGRANQEDELKLVTTDSSAEKVLLTGAPITVQVTLKDGRTLDLKAIVDPARPRLNILSKSVQLDPATTPPLVHLGNPDELPQDGHLNFFLKTQVPEAFPPTERIEVATKDESFRVLLSEKDGNLTQQDPKTVLASLDPMKLLGPSAFGPLKFRPVSADGVEGDWQPLANLVRIPDLKGVRCVVEPEKQCTLVGDKLFLIDTVSTDPEFTNAIAVPDGYVDATLAIPAVKVNTLYLKLRDDPGVVDTAVFQKPATQ